MCRINIPKASSWDITRAFESALKMLPCSISTRDINNTLHMVKIHKDSWESKFISTKEVYQVRKLLKGMVIGGLDKNQNELWATCPVLYEKTLHKLYNADTGYRKVCLRKITSYQRKKHGTSGLYKYVLSQEFPKPRPNQIGSERDVIQAWGLLYRDKGWNRFAKFDRKGAFNIPYCLYKAKNSTPETRVAKLHKARPLAPQTKHPMRDLLGKAGRAWYFMSVQRDDRLQFEIPLVSDIPNFIDRASSQMRSCGNDFEVKLFDIEGCFPNMPKEAIRAAARDYVAYFHKLGKQGVWIPRARLKKPSWDVPKIPKGGTWIPLEELKDILEFALDNAYIKMPDGTIRHQVQGIPMGDPLSPGMTIMTCAWMEREWMSGLRAMDTIFFKAARYMDDIMLFYSKNPIWASERFLQDFSKSECYWAPLKLEEAEPGKFLETSYVKEGSHISYRLKNVNEESIKVWRYHHYRSRLAYATKRATMMAALRKAFDMGSDSEQKLIGIQAKCKEFINLEYPPGILKFMCVRLYHETGHTVWLIAKGTI